LKLGIVTTNPISGSLGTMTVILETSRILIKKGVEVHIFTPYSKNQVINGIYIHSLSQSSILQIPHDFTYKLGRLLYSKPLLAKYSVLNIKNIQKYVQFLNNKLHSALKENEVDILQGEQELAALSCTQVGEKLNLPVVSHIRNYWPEECVDIGLIERGDETYKLLSQLTGNILHNSDLVLTVSSYARDYLKEVYDIVDGKIVELPRGARIHSFNVDYRNKQPSVVYCGSISKHENLELYINSMPFISKQINDSKFYISGKGDYINHIKKLSKSMSVNPNFVWFNEKDHFYSFLSQCSVGVVPWANNFSRKFGFPIKMLDYLSVGLPVVVTNVGTWSEIVLKYGLGSVTEPDPKSFSEGILSFLSDPELSKSCGKRGMNLIREKYNWENTVKLLIHEYNKLLS